MEVVVVDVEVVEEVEEVEGKGVVCVEVSVTVLRWDYSV